MINKLKIYLTDTLFYLIGSMIYAVAVTVFLTPSAISPGGLTGIATILNELVGFPSGVTLFCLNVPIIVLGFVKLGGMFIVRTAVATTVVSAMIDLSTLIIPEFEGDPIMAGLFGGILMGAGLGFIMLRGATTGGTDIIAKLVNRRWPHLTLGRLMLAMDVLVIGLNAVVYGSFESALYSIAAMYVSSKVMDTLLYGGDQGKLIYCISERSGDICAAINERLERGVSKIGVIGGYTGKERMMLMCAVRRHEVAAVTRIISEFDRSAFTIITDAGEIIGEGFKESGADER